MFRSHHRLNNIKNAWVVIFIYNLFTPLICTNSDTILREPACETRVKKGTQIFPCRVYKSPPLGHPL